MTSWAKENFNIFKSKHKIMSRLKGAQLVLEADPFKIFLFDLENSVMEELNVVSEKEEAYRHIRSRTD